MLISLVVELRTTQPAKLPATLGRHTHAWFLSQVGQHDPQMAMALHEPNQERPFTVSNLWGAGAPVAGQIDLAPGQAYYLRVSSYQPRLSALLEEKVVPALTPAMTLAGTPFQIVRVAQEPEAHPWSGRSSFQELIQEHTLSHDPSSSLTLRFASPTVFRSQGSFMPLPLPRLIFEGLVRRWNALAPVGIPDEVNRYAEECMVISRYRLRTERVAFGEEGSRGAFPGFLGHCGYSFRVKDRYWMGLIHMLADFALYAGVGRQTAMGLGQVRRG